MPLHGSAGLGFAGLQCKLFQQMRLVFFIQKLFEECYHVDRWVTGWF